MSISREALEGRTLYLVRVGSHAYGTNVTEDEARARGVKPSDEDYIRIIYELPEELILPPYGFRTRTFTDPDETIYALREYVRVLSSGNPNVLETLWSHDSDRLVVRSPFDRLLSARPAFMSKRLWMPYQGYVRQQYRRYLEGDQTRRTGSREALIRQFGFDTKAAAHIVRLCIQGSTALLTGEIPTRLPEEIAQLVKEIRLGQYDYETVLGLVNESIARLDEAHLASKLPDEPDWEVINRVLLEMHEDIWGSLCVKEGGRLELRHHKGS